MNPAFTKNKVGGWLIGLGVAGIFGMCGFALLLAMTFGSSTKTQTTSEVLGEKTENKTALVSQTSTPTITNSTTASPTFRVQITPESQSITPIVTLTTTPTKVYVTKKVTPTPKKVIPTQKVSSYSCNCKKTCTQIKTCEEAYFQLNTCGCKIRDKNNDGVPCENLCS